MILSPSFLLEIKGKQIFASFSGGADSTALVFLLAGNGIPFTAVHFTHGIRDAETGKREYRLCRSVCRKLGVPLIRRSLNVPAHQMPGEGMEAAARRCRLASWQKLFLDKKDAVVLTAHHADDVRENLFLRLFRGGNVSSLAGLRMKSVVNGITFLRPLLTFSKQKLKDYLASNGITAWAEDATNGQDCAARNFLRNSVLPGIGKRLPFSAGGILASARALADDASFLEECAAEAACGDLTSAEYWKSLHPAIRIRVLRSFLTDAAGCAVIPDWRTFERFNALLELPFTRRLRKMPVSGTELCITLSGKKIGTIS